MRSARALTVVFIIGLAAAIPNALFFLVMGALGNRADPAPPTLLERADFWLAVIGVSAAAAVAAWLIKQRNAAAILAGVQFLIVPTMMMTVRAFS